MYMIHRYHGKAWNEEPTYVLLTTVKNNTTKYIAQQNGYKPILMYKVQFIKKISTWTTHKHPTHLSKQNNANNINISETLSDSQLLRTL